MPAPLPGQFADLALFVPDWALSTEAERSERRWRASKADFEAFYAAMMPRLPEILAFLDNFPIGQVPAEAATLRDLALAFAESAPHVELYRGSAKVPNSFDAHRFAASHGAIVG